MNRLNRAFSHKEIALILFLTLVLLVMVYYRLVYVPIQREIESYDTTQLETEIQVEEARAAQIQRMKEEIASGQGNYNGEVKTYDNQQGEINALNQLFANAEAYRVSARQPVANGNAVRRNVDLSFTVEDYATAERMIEEISNGDFRCLIGNVNITPVNVHELNAGRVSCSLTITFFETLAGTDNRDGLMIQS